MYKIVKLIFSVIKCARINIVITMKSFILYFTIYIFTHVNNYDQPFKGSDILITTRLKSGKFGHEVNSDTRLQTVEIQMSRFSLFA